MQIFSSRRRKFESVLMFSLVGIIFSLSIDLIPVSVLSNPDALAELIGPYGYAGIILTQFAQVLIAPLPPVTPVVSGMLYGTVLGTSLSFIGAALGSMAALLIAKKFGRPAVKKFLSEEALTKFDKYTSGHGYIPFVVLFIFPGFPDDALCFIAGLTNLDWKKLFLIASFGRIPGIALLAITGSSAVKANNQIFLISASAVLIISVLSIRYEKRMEQVVLNIEEEGLGILREVKNIGGRAIR